MQMKPTCILGAILIFSGSLFAAVESQTLTVHFASDGHHLDEESKRVIHQFVNDITLSGDYEFQITGHTDHEGNSSYNDALSARRANEVKNALVILGMDIETCVVESFGEQQLLQTRKDVGSMAENRRVQIVFKRFSFDSIEELKAELARSSINTFDVDPTQDQVLSCSDGTKVKVSANSFLDPEGNVITAPVHIQVIEALGYEDFFSNGLTTWSNERMLKSGGMTQISASTDSGESVELAESSSIQIAIPRIGDPSDAMQLFVSDTGGNWTATPQRPSNPRDLDVSDRPQFSVSAEDLPKYEEDKSAKPRFPGEPSYPLMPSRPRKESYFLPIKWYQFLSKKKIESQYQMRYDNALGKYAQKVTHYEAAIERFEQRCSVYPEVLETYYREMEEWRKFMANERYLFESNDIPEAQRSQYLNYKFRYAAYQKELDKWELKRDKKLEEYNAMLTGMGIPEGESMNYYIFKDTGLGWYNCDKFWDIPELEQADLVVQLSDTKNAEVILVHPKDKSMLSFSKTANGRYKISNIPKNAKGQVLAYRIENGVVLFAKASYRGQKKIEMNYKPIRVRDLRKALSQLNT